MLHQQLIRKGPDGAWVFKAPISADTLVPSIDIDEYGLWVRAAIEHKEIRDDGRAIPVDAEDISLRDMIQAITKGKLGVPYTSCPGLRPLPVTATGTEIRIVDNISFDQSVKLYPEGTPEHIIKDLGIDMWKALDQYGCGFLRQVIGLQLMHRSSPQTSRAWM